MTRPAVVAGWVGAGVAVVVVLSFELVFAVQAIVFLLALPMGLLIGWYAGTRDRDAQTAARVADGHAASPGARTDPPRPGWGRAISNGLVAGAMTAVALAALYVLIRLLFLYFDSGFRAGGPPYSCTSGPECGYQRALDEPSLRAALADAGVDDAAGYGAFFLEGQALGGAALLVLVMGGSLAGSALHAVGSREGRSTTAVAGSG